MEAAPPKLEETSSTTRGEEQGSTKQEEGKSSTTQKEEEGHHHQTNEEGMAAPIQRGQSRTTPNKAKVAQPRKRHTRMYEEEENAALPRGEGNFVLENNPNMSSTRPSHTKKTNTRTDSDNPERDKSILFSRADVDKFLALGLLAFSLARSTELLQQTQLEHVNCTLQMQNATQNLY